MSTKLVNLRIDFAFKQLFGTKGNEEILTGFLNAILADSLDTPIIGVCVAMEKSPSRGSYNLIISCCEHLNVEK